MFFSAVIIKNYLDRRAEARARIERKARIAAQLEQDLANIPKPVFNPFVVRPDNPVPYLFSNEDCSGLRHTLTNNFKAKRASSDKLRVGVCLGQFYMLENADKLNDGLDRLIAFDINPLTCQGIKAACDCYAKTTDCVEFAKEMHRAFGINGPFNRDGYYEGGDERKRYLRSALGDYLDADMEHRSGRNLLSLHALGSSIPQARKDELQRQVRQLQKKLIVVHLDQTDPNSLRGINDALGKPDDIELVFFYQSNLWDYASQGGFGKEAINFAELLHEHCPVLRKTLIIYTTFNTGSISPCIERGWGVRSAWYDYMKKMVNLHVDRYIKKHRNHGDWATDEPGSKYALFCTLKRFPGNRDTIFHLIARLGEYPQSDGKGLDVTGLLKRLLFYLRAEEKIVGDFVSLAEVFNSSHETPLDIAVQRGEGDPLYCAMAEYENRPETPVHSPL